LGDREICERKGRGNEKAAGGDHRYIHRYITSRSNMSISADVHPWGDFSLLTAPPPTIDIISP
jgi:hypothetical protein